MYEVSKKLKENCNLSVFYNEILDAISIARKNFAPSTFYSEGRQADFSVIFYNIILFEMYAHEAVKNLKNLRRKIDEYIYDYGASWEFYARSKMSDMIGATMTTTSYKKEDFTFVKELCDSMTPVFKDADKGELNGILKMFVEWTEIDLVKLFTDDYALYGMDNKGIVYKQSLQYMMDLQLKHQKNLTDYGSQLSYTTSYIKDMILNIHVMDHTKDNEDLFVSIRNNIDDILNAFGFYSNKKSS